MALPDLKYIFYIALFNIFMFVLSFSLQAYFGGGAFITGVDEDLIVAVALPVITGVGLLEGVTNILTFLVSAIEVFLAIFSFDIVGFNWLLRFMLVAPLWVVDIYIVFSILMDIGDLIANLIPFT